LKPRIPWFHRTRSITADRRGVTAVEMAIVLPVFLTFLFVLFEVAYDQFVQGELESALALTAYQVQVGTTEATTSGSNFISTEFCPNALAHALNCNSLYVRMQIYDPSATYGTSNASCTDFYDATNGTLPISGGAVQLGYYSGEQTPPAGNDSLVGPTQCQQSSSETQGVGFCNPEPGQFVIMSAVYVTPSFLGALIPGQSYKYNGRFVHAAFASTAFDTEGFTASTPPTGTSC